MGCGKSMYIGGKLHECELWVLHSGGHSYKPVPEPEIAPSAPNIVIPDGISRDRLLFARYLRNSGRINDYKGVKLGEKSTN